MKTQTISIPRYDANGKLISEENPLATMLEEWKQRYNARWVAFDELMDRNQRDDARTLWEQNLELDKCISELRTALDRASTNDAWIEAVPK